MQDGFDTFWSFLTIAFWVVVIGWFGISLFTPSSSAESSSESTNSSTYEATDGYDSYDSYDSYDYSEEPDYSSSYEEEEPSYYRSTYSSTYDMDCGDFNSWDEAQYHYENVADDNLDGDGDGVACESLY